MSKLSWRRRILFSGVAFVAAFVILEVVLRLFGYGSYIIFQPDDELFFIPKPNQVGRTVANRQRITINSDGLRYPENLPKTNDDELRIVSFGDSVTMGWGVDDQSHYTARLEDQVQTAADKTVRAISAGVNAYPTTLCVRRFEELVQTGHQIDIAVLAFSFNIGHETLPLLSEDAKRDFLRNVRLKNFVRRFALYNLLIEDILREAVYYRIRDQLMEGSWETASTSDSNDEPVQEAPKWGDHLERYQTALERMIEVSEAHGVEPVMLLLGSKGQTGNYNQYQELFAELATSRGITLVDMIDELAGYDHETLFMDHTHPNAKGHELIAQKIAAAIAQRGARSKPAAVESAS